MGHNGFRDRPVQPLRHPSGSSLAERGTGVHKLPEIRAAAVELALRLGHRPVVTGPHLLLRLPRRQTRLLPGLLYLLLETSHPAPQPGPSLVVLPKPVAAGGLLLVGLPFLPPGVLLRRQPQRRGA